MSRRASWTPSQAALDARRAADERAARAGGVHAAPGQIWSPEGGDDLLQILGAKGPHLILRNVRTGATVEVTSDDLVDHYDFIGCDHDASCCTIHGTHTSPHMGCVLR